MSELLLNFHFIRPWWLLALPAAAIFCALLVRHQGARSQWQNIIDERLLPYLLDGQFTSRTRFPYFALLLIWVVASLAIAGPTWKQIPQPVVKHASALIVLWDLSPSMNAQDIKPSRLVRSRLKLIDLLHARNEGLTGLVAYAGEAHVVTPLTDDTKTIISLLPGLDPEIMPTKGSSPEMALKMAITLLKDAGIGQGNILFLTDGIAPDARASLEQQARATRHKISVWGIGTPEGSIIPIAGGGFARDNSGAIVVAKLDETELSDAAIKMGGIYVPFSNSELDINTVLEFGMAHSTGETRQTKRYFDTWQEQGPWLVLCLLPIAAFAFRRGWLLSGLVVFMFIQPPNAQALSWNDLWQTKDQQARQLLGNDEAEKAATTFTNPGWQGTANYKAGKFEEAQKNFSQGQESNDFYNQGNALTQLGQYDDAIAAYDQALATQSDFSDAKENRTIAEKLKQLEEQSQQQDQQGGDDQQQGESSENQSQNSENQDSKQDQQKDSEQQNSEQKDSQADNENSSEQNQDKQALNEEQKKSLDEHYKQPDKEQQEQSAEQDQKENELAQKNAQAEESEEQGENEQQAQPQKMQLTQQQNDEKEQQQALDQWLRKVPDDPSGLMRNKFQYESQQRKRELINSRFEVPGTSEKQRW
ncbi:MAG: Ca-activated chloride channel family protein [Lentisphaeria bacterium]|jgi:Ca-activated chloride channel family protein